MTAKTHNPLIRRYSGNPILTKDDIPYPVETVHNAGVTRFDDGIIMLFRSHLANGRSVIGIADSEDGFTFRARPDPFIVPATQGIFAEYEACSVEDARISCIDDKYLITYSAYSEHGARICLATTTDFESLDRISLITQPDMRNVVIFPECFNGRYARLDRPHMEVNDWSIWISWSPDLIHWGESEVLIKPMLYHWDQSKVGPGATPIKTDHGWLNIYHGVTETMDGAYYRLGVALHDLYNPARVIGVADDAILSPEDAWELTGFVHNVVFTCGAIEVENDQIILYWGGADTVMCAGMASIDELVNLCLNKSRPAF